MRRLLALKVLVVCVSVAYCTQFHPHGSLNQPSVGGLSSALIREAQAFSGWLESTPTASIAVEVSVGAASVAAGGAVDVGVSLTVKGDTTNLPLTSVTIWPYVNGSQWGAFQNISLHSGSKSTMVGSAHFLLPLPNVGNVSIFAAFVPKPHLPFPVGTPLPAESVRSNKAYVKVTSRPSRTRAKHDTKVLLEWEPWFTTLNNKYHIAEAIPLVGLYDSFNTDVMQQHVHWMEDMGVDAVLVDWTNNLWGDSEWSQRKAFAQQLINATTATVEFYAHRLREQKFAPAVVLLLGLDNGINASIPALDGEVKYAYDKYIAPYPDLRDKLYLVYEGKPLITVFDGDSLHEHLQPLNASNFTVRWMSSQLQYTHQDKNGYWSWMDGTVKPITTYHNGSAEALTITPAFFGPTTGWLGPPPSTIPRENGATFLREFETALQSEPAFLVINQWNEFDGQPKGQGYGVNHSIYADCYSVTRSNDIEPTSLNTCGYRGCTAESPMAGYGMLYVNLLRALLDMYRTGTASQNSLVVLSSPLRDQIVNQSQSSLTFQWFVFGRQPEEAVQLYLNDAFQPFATAPPPLNSVTVQLSAVQVVPGANAVHLICPGLSTHYALSLTEVDSPSSTSFPASASLTFYIQTED